MYINNIEDIVEAQNGNKEILQKLINNNNGLIWSIVKRFEGRGYDPEDLYQIGVMGFIKSIQRFDVNFGVQLSTYVVPYVLGELRRFIRDDGPIKISRNTKELLIKIKEVQKQNMINTGKELTVAELAEKLEISKEDVVYALTATNPIESIDEEVYEENGKLRLVDQLTDNKDEHNTMINKIALKDVINNLDSRDKQIILLRYYKDQTQSQVAKTLGITQVQVSRLEKRILSFMKEKMLG